ncbi:hypothetical protein BZA05DRAFT_439832 [Tricharina praecox]|uniref:uncharacterized protein n=1 Tax=Tricharina praecox TaxID=43433 RepID=UPI00222032B9|nr:uncharacterized protein BZA05DRAFT_439832 [Tricharina praecox]KAI5841226.1 hypothetical protein BZA05DRAFT_439832 [Tricharina praecox]
MWGDYVGSGNSATPAGSGAEDCTADKSKKLARRTAWKEAFVVSRSRASSKCEEYDEKVAILTTAQSATSLKLSVDDDGDNEDKEEDEDEDRPATGRENVPPGFNQVSSWAITDDAKPPLPPRPALLCSTKPNPNAASVRSRDFRLRFICAATRQGITRIHSPRNRMHPDFERLFMQYSAWAQAIGADDAVIGGRARRRYHGPKQRGQMMIFYSMQKKEPMVHGENLYLRLGGPPKVGRSSEFAGPTHQSSPGPLIRICRARSSEFAAA